MNKKAILFGASKLGKKVFEELKNKYNICCFCDNDSKKWDTSFCGLPVISPFKLKDYSDILIIITSSYKSEISIQLLKMGIEYFVAYDVLLLKSENAEFDYAHYWNERLENNFNIDGVGYFGLGEIYNYYLYKSRFDILVRIMDQFFKDADFNILEIGPGIGVFTEYFYTKNVQTYFGIDISEKSVKELSLKYKNFSFICGDISERKNFPDKKFNLILGADVLLHVTDETKYIYSLKNLNTSIDDNGLIVLFDPISFTNKLYNAHVRVRNIDYVRSILSNMGLNLNQILPVSYFMNNPFDSLNNEIFSPLNMFNFATYIFKKFKISKNTLAHLAEYLYCLDKLALLYSGYGLSEKVLLISKKNCLEYILDIKTVWDDKKLKQRINELKKEFEVNEELLLSEIRLILNYITLTVSKLEIK